MPYTTTLSSRISQSGPPAVPPYVTLSILVAGVVGGLVIVVAVIVFCKYCVKKDKPLQRTSTSEIRRQSDRERRFKPLQRYETINSDVFSEPSTGSMEGLPISPRKCYDTRSVERYSEVDEVTETTKLKTDFEKVLCQGTEGVRCCNDVCLSNNTIQSDQLSYKEVAEDNQESTQTTKKEDNQENDKIGRRVSFQLENLPPATSTYLSKGRRYTEGDFHHLKRSRIEKVVPRQYSLCAPPHSNGHNSPQSDHRPPVFMEETPERRGLPYRPPLISLAESPSPPGEPSKTEVSVEIHYHINADYNSRKGSLPNRRDSVKSSPRLGVDVGRRVRSHSHSLEVTNHTFYDQRNGRRTKSYEDIVDYDVLKITEFKGPFYNTDFDVISELGSPSGCKVRYNDTGSIEQLNDENLDALSLYDAFEIESIKLDENNDDTETLNGTQKYRELWNLRTTFEEEEECSDTIRMEDTIFTPEQSPEEIPNYLVSSSEQVLYNGRTDRKETNGYQNGQVQISPNTLHPNYENRRRQSYKNILTKRLQKAQQTKSAENSFDSVETVDDTDGDVSDTSRHEVTTTSFETSTDNTDSTTESQNHRLIQMKADSGYKSLENQPPVIQPPGAVKRNHSTGEIEELDNESRFYFQEAGPSGEQSFARGKSFDRRNVKTASKKRREYSRERQAVQIYESINEPETDSRSDQPSGDSFEETPKPSKMSVFSRLFKSQKGNKQRSNTRDYSIDEKTDQLFREFIRYDPKFDGRSNVSPHSHRSPRFHRHRLHRKHTEPMYFEERRRDRLAPEMRAASLGSDSSASSARRISPQDSIEEEDYEEVREAEKSEFPPLQIQRDIPSRQSLSVHEIPVIKLPEEETSTS